MRKILLILSVSVVLICLFLSMFLFWRLSPPGGAFPHKVGDMRRVAGPEFREIEGTGIYAAIYTYYGNDITANGSNGIFHTAVRESSADAAKNMIRSNREEMLKREGELRSSGSTGQTYLASQDSPGNDHLVYVSNEKAYVEWAHNGWYFSVSTGALPTLRGESEDYPYSASEAYDFARSLSYAPMGTTPPTDNYEMGYSLHSLITTDLPILFAYWYPALIPLVLAVPFALAVFVLLIWGFVKGRKKRQTV